MHCRKRFNLFQWTTCIPEFRKYYPASNLTCHELRHFYRKYSNINMHTYTHAYTLLKIKWIQKIERNIRTKGWVTSGVYYWLYLAHVCETLTKEKLIVVYTSILQIRSLMFMKWIIIILFSWNIFKSENGRQIHKYTYNKLFINTIILVTLIFWSLSVLMMCKILSKCLI